MCTGDYDKHLDSIYGVHANEKYTKEIIDDILENLIKCLPNGGKLYKYRTFKTEKDYTKALDTLEQGYLWLSRVDQFRDGTDGAIMYDREKEINALRELFKNKPRLLYKHAMKTFDPNQANIVFNEGMLFEIADWIDVRTGKLNKKKVSDIFKKYGYDYFSMEIGCALIQNYVDTYIYKHPNYAEESLKIFDNYNKMHRQHLYVCSLCDDYQVMPMWDTYVDGDGICIEYDYNKLRYLSYDTKVRFINTFKVIYSDTKEPINITKGIEMQLRTNQKKSDNAHDIMQFGMNTLTKRTDYEKEKEWRIVTYDFGSQDVGKKLFGDIVSTIIFEENTLTTEQGKRIIALCKEKNWAIKVRRLNIEGTEYQYVPYEG